MPTNPATVYADVPGRLVDLFVRDGQMVEEGQPLAVLSNLDKLKEREEYQKEQKIFSAKYDTYFRSTNLADRGIAIQFLQQAVDKEPLITKVSEQIDRLNLYALRDGQVIGVPHRETLHQWFEAGKPFCQVADPTKLEAHLILDQSDVDLIEQGRPSLAQGLRHSRTRRFTLRFRRSPSATGTRFRPSSPTWPAARSPPSPTRRPARPCR